ncbi:hypothetical protein PUN28_010237 [Cardiocondyla obscurior]|uniref:Uncharacterized protein n=1 Tax=Cardiocondyla obscurior TaxID=286306 RepID=A0AAW2FTM9_9HYME
MQEGNLALLTERMREIATVLKAEDRESFVLRIKDRDSIAYEFGVAGAIFRIVKYRDLYISNKRMLIVIVLRAYSLKCFPVLFAQTKILSLNPDVVRESKNVILPLLLSSFIKRWNFLSNISMVYRRVGVGQCSEQDTLGLRGHAPSIRSPTFLSQSV